MSPPLADPTHDPKMIEIMTHKLTNQGCMPQQSLSALFKGERKAASLPPKRGPGRPRKDRPEEEVEDSAAKASCEALLAEAAAPVKRPRCEEEEVEIENSGMGEEAEEEVE